MRILLSSLSYVRVREDQDVDEEYHIVLIFCRSKFSPIAVINEFIEKIHGCLLPMCMTDI